MKIITSFPIATESKDHTEPTGTKNDNTTSKNCHDFLKKCKELNIPIVGFSATPLRDKAEDKVRGN